MTKKVIPFILSIVFRTMLFSLVVYPMLLYQSIMFWLAFEGAKYSKLDGRDLPPHNTLLLAYVVSLLYKGLYSGWGVVIISAITVLLLLHLWGRMPDYVLGSALVGVSLLLPPQQADITLLFYCGGLLVLLLFVRGVSASIPFFVLAVLLGFSDGSILTVSIAVMVLFRGMVFKVFAKSAYIQAVWFLAYIALCAVIYGLSILLPLAVVLGAILAFRLFLLMDFSKVKVK